MKNLQGQMAKAPLGKKVKVGRSRSLSANRPAPRDELGIPDKKVYLKSSFLENIWGRYVSKLVGNHLQMIETDCF